MEKGNHFSVESFAIIIHDGIMLGISLSGLSRQLVFVSAPRTGIRFGFTISGNSHSIIALISSVSRLDLFSSSRR